jgi:hypothetical protein
MLDKLNKHFYPRGEKSVEPEKKLTDQKDFETYEDKIKRELDKIDFIEGYKEDPKYKELVERLHTRLGKNKKSGEQNN